MAITLEKLQELLKQQDFRFYVSPDRPVLRASAAGLFGRYDFVICLLDEGQFLQLRTMNYLNCPPDSPHLPATLRVIAHINYVRRSTKYAWDPSDGEIVAYADTFLVDNDLTGNQLARIMSAYLTTIDIGHARIRPTIETGNDPGEISTDELTRRFEEARKQSRSEPEPPPARTPSPGRPGREHGAPSRDPKPAEPPITEI